MDPDSDYKLFSYSGSDSSNDILQSSPPPTTHRFSEMAKFGYTRYFIDQASSGLDSADQDDYAPALPTGFSTRPPKAATPQVERFLNKRLARRKNKRHYL